MALIDELAARLKETTDDLEAEIGARYPGVGRHAYANEQRRFERDMASVRAARALLADYEADKEAEQVAMEEIFGSRSCVIPVIQQPVDYTPFVKPGDSHSPQLDALLCELGAIGVRLDVLAGK